MLSLHPYFLIILPRGSMYIENSLGQILVVRHTLQALIETIPLLNRQSDSDQKGRI